MLLDKCFQTPLTLLFTAELPALLGSCMADFFVPNTAAWNLMLASEYPFAGEEVFRLGRKPLVRSAWHQASKNISILQAK